MCYTGTDNFVGHVKIVNIHSDLAEDVEIRFYISNYKVNRPLPATKNKKFIGLIKH